jgi:hypothetical protein
MSNRQYGYRDRGAGRPFIDGASFHRGVTSAYYGIMGGGPGGVAEKSCQAGELYQECSDERKAFHS